MARRRKSASVFGGRKRSTKQGDPFIGGIVIVVALIAGAISVVPAWVWAVIGAFLALAGAGYIYEKMTKGKASDEASSPQSTNSGSATTSAFISPIAPTPVAIPPLAGRIFPRKDEQHDDIPVAVRMGTSATASAEHRLPPPPKNFAGVSWIPAGKSIEVAELQIPGGLVYFGVPPRNQSNPAWIDPSKKVGRSGDYSVGQMGYWPSYSEISPDARRAYLDWLSWGRSDPTANIGFVFLYFYGLEYRALIDAQYDAAAKAELPLIARELKRLLDIYGAGSASFRSYAGGLHELLSLSELPEKLYLQPLPELPESYEVPVYLRLALGLAAVDKVPLSPTLARAWVKRTPNIRLRTPALRCAVQFDKLFEQKYMEMLGAGLVLPHNKTKLKFVYRPASAALMGSKEASISFGDVPDVTALTKPIQRLAELAEAVTKELEPYSRYLAKNADAEDALEGLLLLPASLWPTAPRQALEALKSRIGDGMLVVSFQELLTTLNARSTLTKDKAVAMAKALESEAIGVEPDILDGARLPKPADKLALFVVPPGEAASRSTPAYQAAVLTLQVASTVAAADGDFSAHEMNHLREQIESWTHLAPGHVRRLKAHLRLLVDTPASLPALKKKLEPLDATTKEGLGAFMATVAQADGTVTPDEVKMLERIYKALGIDAQKVFSDVHAVSTGDITASTSAIPTTSETGFKLDPARIAALQSDTAKVSALLANIFSEEAVPDTPQTVEAEEVAEIEPSSDAGLLGLDEAHSAFARLLLSRPQWTREELQDVATDMDLMLDGALERVNEAAYDTHDIPFTEGDDPIEVNAEVLEKIEA